jgi:hypothetical protein
VRHTAGQLAGCRSGCTCVCCAGVLAEFNSCQLLLLTAVNSGCITKGHGPGRAEHSSSSLLTTLIPLLCRLLCLGCSGRCARAVQSLTLQLVCVCVRRPCGYLLELDSGGKNLVASGGQIRLDAAAAGPPSAPPAGAHGAGAA